MCASVYTCAEDGGRSCLENNAEFSGQRSNEEKETGKNKNEIYLVKDKGFTLLFNMD